MVIMNAGRKGGMIGRLVALGLLGGAVSFSTPPVVEPVSETPVYMAIRENATVVRETMRVQLTGTTSVVRWKDFPPEADPASLVLIDRRGGAQLLGWQRGASSDPGLLSAVSAGRGVRVPVRPAPQEHQTGLDMHLAAMTPGIKQFDLVYQMTGLTWRTAYDVLVRGSLTEVGRPMSVDVDGWIIIDNQTTRNFARAHVQVIGPDTLGEATPFKPPGILELDDDSPLSDLWRYQEPEPLTPYLYRISTNALLPAQETVMFLHVAVKRKPVERLLVVRAEEIPTDAPSVSAHPSQIISFRNAPDYGRGGAVPPGPASIHLGSQRSALYQNAWFKHTPAQGEIRIDMGKLNDIRVRRLIRARTERADGGYEQVIEVRIENALDQPVQVMLDEQPPIALTWTLLRANQSFERLDRRLIFTPVIDPKSETVIQYSVRVTRPGG